MSKKNAKTVKTTAKTARKHSRPVVAKLPVPPRKLIADPKKDGIPVELQVQNRVPLPKSLMAALAGNSTTAVPAAAKQNANLPKSLDATALKLLTEQTDKRKAKANGRVAKVIAKKTGAAQAMPLEGKAALAAISKAAIENGHPITKIPNKKVPEMKKAAPKKAVAKKATATDKPKKVTIGSVASKAILAGKTNDQALAAVMAAFPKCSSNLACMSWYRGDLRKKGLLKDKK